MEKIKIMKNNVRKYRVFSNITQQELADELKIHVNFLRKIENDFVLPKYQVRQRILKFFNVSQDQMFFKD